MIGQNLDKDDDAVTLNVADVIIANELSAYRKEMQQPLKVS